MRCMQHTVMLVSVVGNACKSRSGNIATLAEKGRKPGNDSSAVHAYHSLCQPSSQWQLAPLCGIQHHPVSRAVQQSHEMRPAEASVIARSMASTLTLLIMTSSNSSMQQCSPGCIVHAATGPRGAVFRVQHAERPHTGADSA